MERGPLQSTEIPSLEKPSVGLFSVERRLGSILNHAQSIPEALEACLDAMLAIPAVDSAAIYLHEDGGALKLATHRNLTPEAAERGAVFAADSWQAGMVAKGEPVYVDGAQPWLDCGALGVALVPVFASRAPTGCLYVASGTRTAFDPAARGTLEIIASWLGTTVSRIRAEQARLESEASYRFLTENIKDVIWSMDFETLRFLYVSPSVKALRGFTPEEVMAQPLDAALPPDVAAGIRAMLRDRLACYETGEKVDDARLFFTEEVPQPCKDGSTVWTEVVTSFWRDPKTGRLEIHGVSRDITERRTAEEEKRQLQAQLVQAGKLEAIGRLAGGIAHDFNNMLTVILSEAEIALWGLTPEDPHTQSFESIKRSAERSAEMTHQLLAFARKQSVIPRVLDINDLVSADLGMLRRLMREDIRLDWKPGDGLRRVRVDPAQVSQILTNLCVNARDAIDGTGTISLATALVTIEHALSGGDISDRKPGLYVALSVSDTGQGMSPEVKHQIFEPFFTTKARGRGTGLGLSTVYGIVRQNAGFISVESQPAHGSTFTVHFPVCTDTISVSEEIPDRAVEVTGKGNNVLLVEDEAAVLRVSRTLIERLGYTVIAAAGPDEALTAASSFPGDIHILVTDVVMPGMSGKELYFRLRQDRPWLKCLYVSGYAEGLVDGAGVLDEGAHVLEKPYTLRSLADKLQEAKIANRWKNRKS